MKAAFGNIKKPLCLSDMKVLKILVKLIIGLFVFAIVGLFFISRGNAFEPGVKNNQLAPCPDRPNCVNSTMNTEDGNYLEAISYSEDLEPIHESIQQIFGPNTQIIKHSQNYMHCTYKVGIWTDDVEFLFDTEQ
ncbi:MAG: DUF1499 domain-containing protein, partial [Bacteroidota bacterium]